MMRKLLALLLALVFAALPALAESAEPAWTTPEVRYAFEHNMLPRYFYDDPQNMLGFLAQSDLYTLWESVATENGVDVCYAREDYVAHTYTYDGDITLLQIELPEPDANLLCYRIYFLYNAGTGEAGYYTVESDSFLPGTGIVCMWTKDREHLNYAASSAVERGDAEALKAEADGILQLAGMTPAASLTLPSENALSDALDQPEPEPEPAGTGPQPMGTFDFTDDILPDGTLIYYFQDLSLSMPASWRGKLVTGITDSGVSFYQRDSYDRYLEEGVPGGGFLFQLGASVNQSFTELPAYAYLGFSERSAMNYYLLLPTDYPAYMEDDIRAEYDAMAAEVDFVVEHASFYPEADSAD